MSILRNHAPPNRAKDEEMLVVVVQSETAWLNKVNVDRDVLRELRTTEKTWYFGIFMKDLL